MVQANSVAAMIRETFGVPQWITGIIITVLTASVILGGIKSIAAWCERLVPFMAIFFVIGAIILLALRYETIPETIRLIVSSAFTGQAAVGGFLGTTVREAARYGIARGLFSNESGLGSRADCRRRRPDEKSRAAGPRFLDRHVLGYGRGMRPDGSGDRQFRSVDPRA